MKKLQTEHPAIVEAYLTTDQDGDRIVVVKTNAVLFPDSPEFDQEVRDAVEAEWLNLFREHRCLGGKLVSA